MIEKKKDFEKQHACVMWKLVLLEIVKPPRNGRIVLFSQLIFGVHSPDM